MCKDVDIYALCIHSSVRLQHYLYSVLKTPVVSLNHLHTCMYTFIHAQRQSPKGLCALHASKKSVAKKPCTPKHTRTHVHTLHMQAHKYHYMHKLRKHTNTTYNITRRYTHTHAHIAPCIRCSKCTFVPA